MPEIWKSGMTSFIELNCSLEFCNVSKSTEASALSILPESLTLSRLQSLNSVVQMKLRISTKQRKQSRLCPEYGFCDDFSHWNCFFKWNFAMASKLTGSFPSPLNIVRGDLSHRTRLFKWYSTSCRSTWSPLDTVGELNSVVAAITELLCSR